MSERARRGTAPSKLRFLCADMDGFFKKEGLTVKVNTARGSAPAIQAVLSGTALLSWVGWLSR